MSRTRTVTLLGLAQTLAWASSYYLPAMLAVPIARDLGIAPATVFAAFSMALGLSAPLGPWSGRLIDRHGGRPVLVGTNLVFAAGIGSLALVHDVVGLFAAWALIGLAMGCGLYEAAFAALVRLYGRDSRSAITGITLLAGFASTVGWPLSAWMSARWGWRGACVGWAVMHLAIGVPLNLALPRGRAATPDPAPAPAPAHAHAHAPAPAPPPAAAAGEAATAAVGGPETSVAPARPMLAAVLLAFVFAATWFTSTAMAAHLPRLLQDSGATLAAAVAVGALVGPAQVAGRVLEFGVLQRLHPLLSARLAALGHPLGVLALLLLGPAMAPAFAILHGMGNGIMTIAKGTLPLALFGAQGYGERQGWLIMPSRVASALAPFVAGLALDAWGARTLWLTGALGLLAFAALLAMPHPATLRDDRHP